MRPALVVLLAATCASVSLLPASAQGIVFDPSVFGRQFEQLTEMKRQFEALSSQLKVALCPSGRCLTNQHNMKSSRRRPIDPETQGEKENISTGGLTWAGYP